MSASEFAVEILGGPSVFKGRAAPTSTEVRARIKQGLPYRSLESLRASLLQALRKSWIQWPLAVPFNAIGMHVPLFLTAKSNFPARCLGRSCTTRILKPEVSS